MSTLADYPHLASGKVRDLYEVDDETLLLVASDRISAYDHVLSTPIPDKGRVLTALSVFWFGLLGGRDVAAPPVAHHLIAARDERIPDEVRGRALLVRRLDMVPVECVARGYLSGSGTVDYRRDGAVCGVALPDGLTEASMLPGPIFTPATKAEYGEHDENVTFDAVVAQLGPELAGALRDATLSIYARGSAYAASRGIILADTKLEFGLDPSGAIVLGDEVLTPDSSRFWPADAYAPGVPQPSFDKQYVRDWLTSDDSGWDRHGDAPPPPLPDAVVQATRARYIEAYTRLTGHQWPPPL
ncbi:phosphoribosylaminoimidazolesuccinocarboxamide synthase [Actinomycetospora endophytica]|uniref:Phosphoribosylaminoimidazole-succinocarboxamide synthase n=1 Tax=Actinomycetospora endophytica TaxID=2291215 RepID=A0ABS8P3S4_9PSEU|nr:phosphoribosylaminoimidazolesuccinocarboxamide synthase [Actinomycetospora endophytica]MCD2192902.1 phosphoribosylaminoimidazolesuccinocarboxamide synthase [Actinomycetospora endophytica]